MRNYNKRHLISLIEQLNVFSALGNAMRLDALQKLSASTLPDSKSILPYFNALLFVIAYPCNSEQSARAEKELERITHRLKKTRSAHSSWRDHSGMPFSSITTRFSHDAVRWLLAHPNCKIVIDSLTCADDQLNEILRLTLPSLEKSETTAGFSNVELMDALSIPAGQQLSFIINELSIFDDQPFLKDYLFDKLGLFVKVTPKNKNLSRAYNRLTFRETFYHDELIKHFNPHSLIDTPVPKPQHLSPSEREFAIQVVKNTMLLEARETDPTTYLQDDSFRLYPLDRGVSVAIYGMTPSRQLPLESYVGYTAFKNGLPVAYGGAWIFGERANFGINIFDSFRKGESAYLMAQLLRLYHHVFKVNYYEVEPFQFGLDNTDGISSGAFWFYYRFGFRPLDKMLKAKAQKESKKIKQTKGYRTSSKVLIEFTGSHIALNLGRRVPLTVQTITGKVTRMIQRTYRGDRQLAIDACQKIFLQKTGIKTPKNRQQKQVFTEVALWAEAMKITDKKQLDIMAKMISTKPKDVYAYQELLLRFFKNN